MATVTVTRYHDFSYGHRVFGHESKCAGLHGHNGRVYFTCGGTKLDTVGRVIDFGVIKSLLCDWVEREWDHKFLLWEKDIGAALLRAWLGPIGAAAVVEKPTSAQARKEMYNSMVLVPFNPTAENMALYLLKTIGPAQLEGTGVKLLSVRIDETRKCSAEVGEG